MWTFRGTICDIWGLTLLLKPHMRIYKLHRILSPITEKENSKKE